MVWIIPNNHPLYSAFARDMAASKLDLKECLGESPSSLMWRSKPSLLRTWLLRWKRDKWFRRLSGRILKPCARKCFEDTLIFSLEVIRASRSARPENDGAQMTHGTFGRGLPVLSGEANQNGFFSKMLRDILVKGSPKSSPIWKKWRTGLSAEYSARLKSAHLTNENGSLSSGSWSTPKSNESTECMETILKRREKTGVGAVKLTAQVNRQTPAAQNSTGYQNQKNGGKIERLGTQVKNWPTPTARDHKSPISAEKFSNSRPLNEVVYLNGPPAQDNPNMNGKNQESWRTPAASDGEGGVKTIKSIHGDPAPKIKLRDHVNHNIGQTSKSKLNPAWVEQLMGIPTGWTACDYWETE